MQTADVQTFNCFEDHPLELESGKTLGPITLAYETYGTLNHDHSNAILICHALSGDAHAAFLSDKEDPKSLGWWDAYIGPEKAIDTNTHFVICINSIGGCKGSTGPLSWNPKTGKAYERDFPVVTIGDMVKTQKALIDHMNIPALKMVIGGSMGGMQALEWVAMYPDKVRSCVPIAATGQVSPLAVAFDAVGRHAIVGDKHYQDGYYPETQKPEAGLAIARMIGHITYLSEQSMADKFGRSLQNKDDYSYNFDTDFQVESYLTYQGKKFVDRFDANSYMYLTKAVSYFDMPKKYGSMETAFKDSFSKYLVISITSDWLYTPRQSKAVARSLMKLNKEVTYIEVDSHYGHDAFLIESDTLKDILHTFLESIHA